MRAKTLLVAASAIVAFGISPALAGGGGVGGCSGGGYASTPATVVDADQSTPAGTETYSSIPYPLPTIDEETLTASVEDQTKTSTE